MLQALFLLLRVCELSPEVVRLGQRRVQSLHDVGDARDAGAELLDLAEVLGAAALAVVQPLVQVPDLCLVRVRGRGLFRKFVQGLSECGLEVVDPCLEQLFLFRGAFLRGGL